MSHKTSHLLLLPLLFALSLAGCKKKDIDAVSEAQACLDKSTSENALLCLEKVEGIESEAAYLMRCSAHLIHQEFSNPTRLANIAEQMKSSGGSSPLAAIGLLSFSKPLNDANARAQLSTLTMSYCEKARSKGMLLLSSMSRMATTAGASLPQPQDLIDNCDPASGSYSPATCESTAKQAICQSTATAPEVLGGIALAAYQQSCLGSTQQNSSVCEKFASITNGSTDPAAIGTNLRNQDGGCPP